MPQPSQPYPVQMRDGRQLVLAWGAATDVGLQREINEDSYLARPPVWAVADGMGGHESGDVASCAVVERLQLLEGPEVQPEQVVDRLREAVEQVAAKVGDVSAGTTVTGAALWSKEENPAWLVFNLGDSRVYCLYDGGIQQLTIDHSVVQQMVEAGQLLPEEADLHPYSNIITRAVGFSDDPVPDFSYLPLIADMRLVICSDGLSKELGEADIAEQGLAGTPQEAAELLLSTALSRGGRDNITVVVVEVSRS